MGLENFENFMTFLLFFSLKIIHLTSPISPLPQPTMAQDRAASTSRLERISSKTGNTSLTSSNRRRSDTIMSLYDIDDAIPVVFNCQHHHTLPITTLFFLRFRNSLYCLILPHFTKIPFVKLIDRDSQSI